MLPSKSPADHKSGHTEAVLESAEVWIALNTIPYDRTCPYRGTPFFRLRLWWVPEALDVLGFRPACSEMGPKIILDPRDPQHRGITHMEREKRENNNANTFTRTARLLVFRSARTSWNTFVRPFVRPQEKSESPLKPYKSSQDHARHLIWNIAGKRTMSSIIWWCKYKDKDKDKYKIHKYTNGWVGGWYPDIADWLLMVPAAPPYRTYHQHEMPIQ